MHAKHSFILSIPLCRYFFSSSVQCKNYGKRQSKFLSKMVSKDHSKKKWYPDAKNYTSNTLLSTQSYKVSIHVKRRMTALNKIFMKSITDIMSTGETSAALLDRNIEVTRVEVSQDFKIVNVFWIDRDNVNKCWSESTEELLKRTAFDLRDELSKLRVISVIPPIQFVKDKTASLVDEIEYKLNIADYGEDYIPTTSHYNKMVQISVVPESGIVSMDLNIDNNADKHIDYFEITLPQMRHDVLGLNHEHIMSQIKASMIKIQEADHSEKALVSPQDQLFTQFLLKQQIDQKRKKHMKKSEQKRFEDLFHTEEEPTYFDDDYRCDEKDYVDYDELKEENNDSK